MNFNLAIGLSLGAILSIGNLAFSQIPDPKTERLEISTEVALHFEPSRGFVGVAELNALPAGSDIELTLKLSNRSSEKSFDYEKVNLHCACERFDLKESSIPARGDVSGILRFKVGLNRSVSRKMNLIFVNAKGEKTGEVEIQYPVAGLLAFSHPIGHWDFPAGKSVEEFAIPFYVTAPIEFESLEISAPKKLEGIEIALVKGEVNHGFVKLTCPSSMIPEFGIAGEFLIQDGKSKAQDTCFLTIKRKGPCKLSPGILRFQDEGEEVTAHLVLRVTAGAPEQHADSSSGPKSQNGKGRYDREVSANAEETVLQSAKCFCADQAIDMTTKQLSDGFYRIKISMSRDLLAALEKKIQKPELKFTFGGTGWSHEEIVPFLSPLK